MVDFCWMTGGKQGSGIDSALNIFSKMMMQHGYYIYGYREYFSNIKGMHSFFTVRVSDKKILAMPSKVDMAIFFDNESVFGEINKRGEIVQDGHIRDIKSGGTIITDSKADKTKINRNDIKIIQIDFDAILSQTAKETGKPITDLAITKNVISASFSAYLLGVREEEINNAIKKVFSKKAKAIADLNIDVVKNTLGYVRNKGFSPLVTLPQLPKKDSLYLEGFTASAIGKAIAGCKMQVYYPITPASDESFFIEEHTELGMRVVQPESEIAVVGMTTGASIAGIRASTSTSGPGLSLMTETITWAGMTETPLVVVDHQRGAPATGQPTRTEQADLSFALNLGHGDYGKIVVAPGSIEESISVTALAFNYAEKFQLPVIVIGEKALTQASISMEKKDILKIKENYRIERGKLVEAGGENYKRYDFTDDNVSKRIKLGDPTAIMWTTGDEHDEWGHISEDPNNRNKMMEKRTGKTKLILSSIPADEKFNITGDPAKADILVVGWGGPSMAIAEAIKENAAFLQIKLIQPFPTEIAGMIAKAKKVACIEQNISGQLCRHIAAETGIMIENQILKYNGRPMRYDEIRDGIDSVLKGEKKVVLNAY